MPGPAPKPDAERRRRNKPLANTTRLPSEGRSGDTPAWPLSKASASELKVWGEVWKTPQSVAWEKLGWERTVARYVRVLVQAEKRTATGVQLQEARQLEDRLGLTPMSMLRLRWEIVVDEVSERRQEQIDEAASVHRIRPVADAGEG